jgi:hypothetical protein
MYAATEARATTVERLGARQTFERSALPETVERQAQGATVWEPGGLESPSAQRSFPEVWECGALKSRRESSALPEDFRAPRAPRGTLPRKWGETSGDKGERGW